MYLQFIVVIVSIIIGALLQRVGMILPWLFGPMVAAILVRHVLKKNIAWPKYLSDIGLFLLGAQIGTSFTRAVVNDVKADWLNVILVNILIILFALFISLLFKKITRSSIETAFLSSIPGALSQMIVMSEENKNASVLVVTLSQTSRLLFVVVLVPLITAFVPRQSSHVIEVTTGEISFLHILSLILFTMILYYSFKKISFPVPQLLAPIIVISVWNLTTDLTFNVPYSLIAIAQILFGVRIGLQMYDLSYQLNRRLFAGVLLHNILLIIGTVIITMVFQLFTNHQFTDLFLSAAPGGMAQIIIVGLETGSNVAMISSYHIFRIFFILLIVSPILNLWLKRSY